MQRLDAFQLSPDFMRILLDLENRLTSSEAERGFAELVRLRVSQLNGCSFCVDMHAREARQFGEPDQRINLVSAWRDASLFNSRERAVLGWAEALTRLGDHQASDEMFTEVRKHLSEKEAVDLALVIGMINLWNRLGVACQWQHPVVGKVPSPSDQSEEDRQKITGEAR